MEVPEQPQTDLGRRLDHTRHADDWQCGGRSMYYDLEARPCTFGRWAELTEANRRIGGDQISGYWVSTVWIGIDHNFGSGPPLIFETMIFPDGEPGNQVYCERYPTRAAALAGHDRALTLARHPEHLTELGRAE